MGFLTDLVASRRRSLDESPLDVEALTREAAERPPARDLARALRRAVGADGVAVIAEIKRASPSAGSIAGDADAAALAAAYAAGGAAAISVLTEPLHFAGSLDDLRAARGSTEEPLLRKDFLVHPSQLQEARAAGADSVLLIAGALPDGQLDDMIEAARGLGMEPLVETHSEDDLGRALATSAMVIGVNARDLESLEVDVDAALGRLAGLPGDRLAVLESGVRNRGDVERAVAAGASAILVGETLMRSGNPGALIAEIAGRDTGEEPEA